MKAWGKNLVVKLDSNSGDRSDKPLYGEILSKGDEVPQSLKEGVRVVFGKYAGQIINDTIILNYNEILAIDE